MGCPLRPVNLGSGADKEVRGAKDRGVVGLKRQKALAFLLSMESFCGETEYSQFEQGRQSKLPNRGTEFPMTIEGRKRAVCFSNQDWATYQRSDAWGGGEGLESNGTGRAEVTAFRKR